MSDVKLRWYNWYYKNLDKPHMSGHIKIRTFSEERALALSENAKKKLEEQGFKLVKEESFDVLANVDEVIDIFMLIFGEENVCDAINFKW